MIKAGDSYRKLYAVEGERLQTLPDDYTATGIKNGQKIPISTRQRFKTISNGFTADIISHILSPLLKDNPEMNNKHSRQLGLF